MKKNGYITKIGYYHENGWDSKLYPTIRERIEGFDDIDIVEPLNDDEEYHEHVVYSSQLTWRTNVLHIEAWLWMQDEDACIRFLAYHSEELRAVLGKYYRKAMNRLVRQMANYTDVKSVGQLLQLAQAMNRSQTQGRPRRPRQPRRPRPESEAKA